MRLTLPVTDRGLVACGRARRRPTSSFPRQNLHIQGGVSALVGVILLRTHEGSITKDENARFVADLFVAAQRTDEYRELPPTNKIVIMTDNAPAPSRVEDLARQLLVSDGIMNGNRLSKMRAYMATKKQEFLVRGDFDTYTAHRLAIMKEAVGVAVPAITRRLV
ncbi:Transposase [Phytophthora megakarya]|uniref:Transposase n=1 Tax=Phytophthora megakarya TaxID=4795 RepID=A0A225V439_9STRA|nr:Transposase [Phytophthora megakarya]